MKRLLLLRHAKAVPAGPADHDRALAPKGLRDAATVGQAIVRSGRRPQAAIVSDARRTRETYDALALGAGTALRLEAGLYEATPDAILAAIAGTADEVATLLVVGHNPGIALTALALATTGPAEDLARLRAAFPTACLAVLGLDLASWARIADDRAGRLEELLWTGTDTPAD